MRITVFEGESICGDDLSLDFLNRYGSVRFYGVPDPAEVPNLIGDSEAVLCSKVLLGAEVFDACPNLRYIGLMATGYNNVDVAEAARRGITVTNIPDYSSDAVAQMTLAFLLQFATNLISYTESTRRGDWLRSEIFCYYPYPMMELRGKTLGLFGMGSIAKKVAEAAAALGMRILYHATTEKKDLPYTFVSKERLWEESDFLSLHCPLNDGTREIICRDTLARMKKTAFLINTARGGLVREEDLAEALREGRLAGYAADVLAIEPQRADCPLIGAPRCILTPHVAWAPAETRRRLMTVLGQNLEAWQKGVPQNTVFPK